MAKANWKKAFIVVNKNGEEKRYDGLFTSIRVQNNDSGLTFDYQLRHGDDDSVPATIEKFVKVNFFGTFVSSEDILEDAEYLEIISCSKNMTW